MLSVHHAHAALVPFTLCDSGSPTGIITFNCSILLILLFLAVIISLGIRDGYESIVFLLYTRDEVGKFDLAEGFEDIFGFDGFVVIEDGAVVGAVVLYVLAWNAFVDDQRVSYLLAK